MNLHPEGYGSGNGQSDGLKNVNGDVVEHTKDTRRVFEGSSDGSFNHNRNQFHVLRLKQACNADFPAANVPDMMIVNSIENASSQSLFNIVHKILDDNIENKKEDVPDRVASLLKSLVQEIEQRILKQAEGFKKQNNLYKTREEKYQLKIRVLETLAVGATEENEVVMNLLQHTKAEKTKIEEKKKLEDEELVRLRKDNDDCNLEILKLKHELEATTDTYKKCCMQLETHAMEIKAELEKKITDLENLLADSNKKVKELEKFTESKFLRWKKKERGYKNFMDLQYGSLKELKRGSGSIKQLVLKTQQIYSEEIYQFGIKIQGLVDAAQNYHTVLTENRKLYNEVQDLKGNIRVYCRIRPFLKGQSQKQTTIEYIGENGELVVTNPSKLVKESHRLFKFNKVFSPAATQEEVFLDTQPLIRSVLDGYNVCIFAYGQTGSGKTYTMTGPSVSSPDDWGVNYRALNDLFHLSQARKSSFEYEIGVQMVEIYNEQVRDLLSNETTQKRLGIWNSTQPNGLAVPDASMHPVTSTAAVLDLMNVGLMNRAVGATALNERSSRSHSVLTVHVRGVDLETNAVLHGNLHLVDLAGSERVDRSEATGDRLREAQHINKSLSALGDVIFALAHKSQHVPYRNSKLTQVLQSSLGGQAKTLMFVQLNPDVESFSETISTLKFAERVSGVELGAARSNKEGRGIRELMEQVTSLKDAMAKKDEEIVRLRLHGTNSSGEKHVKGSPRYRSSSPRRHSIGGIQPNGSLLRDTSVGRRPKAASDIDNCSEFSDKQSETSSQQSNDEFRRHKEFFKQSRLASVDSEDGEESRHGLMNAVQDPNEDIELLGLGDADSEERLSDISDGVLSMGTETDGSLSSIVEFTLFPEAAKAPVEHREKPNVPAKLPRPPQKAASSLRKQAQTASSSQRQGIATPPPQRQGSTAAFRPSLTKGFSRNSSSASAKKATSGSSSSLKSGPRR